MKNLKGIKLLNNSEQRKILGGIELELICRCTCPEGFSPCGGTCANGEAPQFYGLVSKECYDKYFPK